MKVTHPHTDAGSSARYWLTHQPPFTAGPSGVNKPPTCCLFRQLLGNAGFICPANTKTAYFTQGLSTLIASEAVSQCFLYLDAGCSVIGDCICSLKALEITRTIICAEDTSNIFHFLNQPFTIHVCMCTVVGPLSLLLPSTRNWSRPPLSCWMKDSFIQNNTWREAISLQASDQRRKEDMI